MTKFQLYLNHSLLFFSIVILSTVLKAQDKMTIQGKLYSDNTPVEIFIEKGIIIDIEPLEKNNSSDQLPIISPGFIDVQINGYAGKSFTEEGLTIEDVRKVTQGLWKEGVTTYLPTIITSAKATIIENLQTLNKSLEDESISNSVPGFFLEGPYISPLDGFRGAHNAKYIRSPDWDEFEMFIQASGNNILKITLAPELDGAMDFIVKCKQNNIMVAIGHHNGNAEQIHLAAQKGASIATHLGNGCANTIHRHNNPLWAQMADDRLTPTIIADGFHLNPDELMVFYKVKGPDNLLLISDVTKLAGMPPGEYMWDGKKVLLTPEGKLRLPDLDVLAGASLSIRLGIGNMMKFTGCSLKEAIQMASTNQALMFGWNDRGSIQIGKRADLVLFELEEGEVKVQKTIIAGKVVYSNK